MKYTTLLNISIFIMWCGNYNAQNYVEINAYNNANSTNEIQPQYNPMPDWEKNWTKESIIAINKIIKEYGCPDENIPNRMQWNIPGEIKKTITYTENFLFYLPFETNSCNKDCVVLIVKNH